MKIITNFLKRRRKAKLLRKISILKIQSDQYLKLSELEKENAEHFKNLINITTKKAEYNDFWVYELEYKLSNWNKKCTEYMLSSTAAFTKHKNIEYKLNMLEKELNKL